jgi:hypothetical protein
MRRYSSPKYSLHLKVLLLIFLCLAAPRAYGQLEREVPSSQGNEYEAKFFDQLRSIFGRFRDADLQRVFQMARPMQCSELVTDNGEWREVAFFNENRKLGDWYRTNLDEVKSDLAVYTFKGDCRGRRSPVQVTTRFPVDESIKSYRERRITFREIDVNVNSPVTAAYDSQTEAYTFDLPYLFRAIDSNDHPVYTLNPHRLTDRYATDVTNRWECKSVGAEDVTYQFLICHTTLVSRGAAVGSRGTVPFGASAYSILSDGKEASSSVRLAFGGPPESTAESTAPRSSEPRPTPERQPVEGRTWRPVASQPRLTEIGQSEFRLRFNAETWKGRIGQPQLIADGNLTNFGAATVQPHTKDYCVWRPGEPAQANRLLDSSYSDSIVHSLEFRKEVRSATSAIVEMQSETGLALGALQCFFPKSQTPGDITAGMWLSIVGSSVGLEVPGQ